MSDMEELPLHAPASKSELTEEAHSLLVTPKTGQSGLCSPVKSSPTHQGDASWDPVWSHAHFSSSKAMQGQQCSASEGGSSELLAEWEVLTEPGTPISHHSGSPARCVTPGLSSDSTVSLLPQLVQMQSMSVPDQLQSSSAALAPGCEIMGRLSDGGHKQAGVSVGSAHPGSGSFSGSLDSADHLDSPYSADLIIASVEDFRASENSVGAAAAAARSPPRATAEKQSSAGEDEYEYVHGAVGAQLSRIWEWLERLGGRAGRWTSSHLSAIHSYVSGLRCEAFLPPDMFHPPAARAASKWRPGNPLARTVFVQGAICVALAATLAMYVADHRRLAGRLRQKDAELAALIMKVFSLQESLQGARRLPVICHAMAPMKAQSYL